MQEGKVWSHLSIIMSEARKIHAAERSENHELSEENQECSEEIRESCM